MDSLLTIESLRIDAKDRGGVVTIVDDISFSIKDGETLGVVGESGSGKTVTAYGIGGLLKSNQSISNGKITFKGMELTSISKKELRSICGKEIGFIFQEPMSALNPFFTIGKQLREPLIQHMKMDKKEARKRSIELLKEVGIRDAEKVLKSYPHQFSGGMRQRVLIAMAISCNPSLLIADEPTTALDVIIQAQILKILKRLIKERGMSLLLISHDLGVISQMSERVAVMYAGELVEVGSGKDMMKRPKHPYSRALLSAAKEISGEGESLTVVDGSVPRPGSKFTGCRFADRCSLADERCRNKKPQLNRSVDQSWVKCFKSGEDFE